jgi:hypothetical protein
MYLWKLTSISPCGTCGSFPKPHEPYGVFLNDTMVALEDGTPVSAWLAHAACMGKGNKSLCDRTSFPGSTYEDNWTAENAMTLIGRRPINKPFFIQVSVIISNAVSLSPHSLSSPTRAPSTPCTESTKFRGAAGPC